MWQQAEVAFNTSVPSAAALCKLRRQWALLLLFLTAFNCRALSLGCHESQVGTRHVAFVLFTLSLLCQR